MQIFAPHNSFCKSPAPNFNYIKYHIFEGIYKTISGNKTSIKIINNNIIIKGIEPAKTFCTGILAYSLVINRFNPTGGVTKPISNSNTKTTPNRIGSKPNSTINGNTIGNVINKEAIISKNSPKIIYIIINKNKIVYTDYPLLKITLTILIPILVFAIKLANMFCPMKNKKIIDVCLAVVINES